MHPYPGIMVAIGRPEVYYTRAAFIAGIKSRHCIFYVIRFQLAILGGKHTYHEEIDRHSTMDGIGYMLKVPVST